MEVFAFPRSARIRKTWEYQKTYKEGKRTRGEGFTLIARPNGTDTSRLGISISGVRGAVRRNRIKRILREFFRLHRSLLLMTISAKSAAEGMDVVFTIRNNFHIDSPQQMAKVVAGLAKRWQEIPRSITNSIMAYK